MCKYIYSEWMLLMVLFTNMHIETTMYTQYNNIFEQKKGLFFTSVICTKIKESQLRTSHKFRSLHVLCKFIFRKKINSSLLSVKYLQRSNKWNVSE